MVAASTQGQSSTRTAPLRLPVLMYHHVGPKRDGTNRWLTVTPKAFRSQMQWLAKHGHSAIRSSDWLAWLRDRRPLPPKPVLLTFDDGYRDLAHHAFPVLREFGFSGLVFLVTGLLGKRNEWDLAEYPTAHELLGSDELRRWSGEGIEFGAHSRTHADLRTLAGPSLEEEVAGSSRDLQALLGTAVCSFAYPYGHVNAEVRHAVATAFPLGFGTDEGLNDPDTDRLQLRRTMVLPGDTGVDLRFRVSRGSSPIGRIRGLAAFAGNRLLGRND